MAIFMGIDSANGVVETRISIVFGVLFSSSTIVATFKVIVHVKLLSINVFCNFSFSTFSSFVIFATFSFDDIVKEMGIKGGRVNGDSRSRTLLVPIECFVIGTPVTTSPLLAARI
jgi:hypothetical protein